MFLSDQDINAYLEFLAQTPPQTPVVPVILRKTTGGYQASGDLPHGLRKKAAKPTKSSGHRPPREAYELAMRLHALGAAPKQIADRVGVRIDTVRSWLRQPPKRFTN